MLDSEKCKGGDYILKLKENKLKKYMNKKMNLKILKMELSRVRKRFMYSIYDIIKIKY